VYGERLTLVSPTRDLVVALSKEYARTVASGASDALYRIREAGVRIALVSGGIREAILPIATQLGIDERDVCAVSLQFGEDGRYAGYDQRSPLTTSTGKSDVVKSLGLAGRTLAVGDGATDVAMRDAVDTFGAFVGFVRRKAVVEQADVIIESFDQLAEIVLA
jgi:phosphoserine phosphatase